MRLQRLTDDAAYLVTPMFAAGDPTQYEETTWAPLVEDCGAAVDLTELGEIVDSALESFPTLDPDLDAWIAGRLHQALPLSRRVAADPGVWRFLAVVLHPDCVRHRWGTDSWSVTRRRFWLAGTRHDHNPFSRWWWLAELSRSGSDYSRTARLFRTQGLAIGLFVRNMSAYPPLVAAAIDVLGDAPPKVLERVLPAVQRELGSVVLETRSESDLSALFSRHLGAVRQGA